MYIHKRLVLLFAASLLSSGMVWAQGDEDVKLPINESKERTGTTSSTRTISGSVKVLNA